MAATQFTEKELDYIKGCTVDKKGVILEKPAAPFPSLYRKGVITARENQLIVTKEFRDMFHVDPQVVKVEAEEAGIKPCPVPKKKPAKKREHKPAVAKPVVDVAEYDVPEGVPADFGAFRELLTGATVLTCTKGIDELALVDKAECMHDTAVMYRNAHTDILADTHLSSDKGKRRVWRFKIMDAVARYIGVSAMRSGDDAVFIGDAYSVTAAKAIFEFLYIIGNRRAQRAYDDALAADGSTIGVYKKAADEFIAVVLEKLV